MAAVLLGGMAGVLAACGGGSGGAPPPPTVTLQTITITPATPSVVAGTTVQLTATGNYNDSSHKDLTATAAWSTSAANVATVGATTGLVTGAKGASSQTAVITATASGVSGTDAVSVTGDTVTKIVVTAPKATIAHGTMQKLTAIGTYTSGSMHDVTAQASWSSAAPAQVSVSDISGSKGVVTGVVASGPVSITAAIGATTGSTPISVSNADLAALTITPAAPRIGPNATLQFKATGGFNNSTTQDITGQVTWSSATPSVATLSAQGLATAVIVGTGTTSIRAASVLPLVGITATPVTLEVSNTVYAYATNFGDVPGTVSQYSVGTGGLLQTLGAPVPTGTNPFAISVEPTGQFAYVANFGSASVSQFQIGATGLLLPTGGGPVPTGNRPNGVTTDHAHQYAYVANFGGNNVSQYSIGTDGALTPLSTPTVAAGKYPSTIAIDPTDSYAYVANFGIDGHDATPGPGTGTLSQYFIDLTLHTLTPIPGAPTVATDAGPNSIAISGTNVYVANSADNTVSQYFIGSNGGLNPIAKPVAVGKRPFTLAVDPTGKYLYVANSNDGTITLLNIAAGGSLTAMPAVNSGVGVSSVTIDPKGTYLYATNRGTVGPPAVPGMTLSQFSIGAGGVLTPLTPATVPSGQEPTSIATGY